MMRAWWSVLLALALVAGCGGHPGTGGHDDGGVADDGGATPDGSVTPDAPHPTDGAPPTPTDANGTDAGGHDAATVTYQTVVMAADIAENGRTQYARTAAGLITSHNPPVTAVVLGGDNARYLSDYNVTITQLQYYNNYYKPAAQANWGQFDGIVFPQAGNHENPAVIGNQGYFDYFATRMTSIKALPGYSGLIDTTTAGYYSFNLNGWHFVSLNSNCGNVTGACAAGGAQETWLKADLQAHPNMPIVAIWHAPRYTCGGSHGDATEMQDLWADLVDARADFVFTGHNHYYERWKPLDKTNPQAVVDAQNGLTQVVVGSYGVTTYTACSTLDSRVQSALGGDPGMGVFFLTIGSDGSYSFEYQLVSDGSTYDSGSGLSHHG